MYLDVFLVILFNYRFLNLLKKIGSQKFLGFQRKIRVSWETGKTQTKFVYA